MYSDLGGGTERQLSKDPRCLALAEERFIPLWQLHRRELSQHEGENENIDLKNYSWQKKKTQIKLVFPIEYINACGDLDLDDESDAADAGDKQKIILNSTP